MSQSQPVKVFLADRYPHFRENLKSAFKKKEIEVSGEADTAEHLIRQLELNRPDLLITAHRLLDESAESFLPIIKEKYPDIKILLLTLNCHKKVFLKYTPYVQELWSKGNSQLEQSIYLIHVTDWVSVYLADKNRVDASEINVINDLKGALSKL